MSETATKRPAIIGLTGGIGSGKSSVASMFSSLGVPVLDLDTVGHQVLDEDKIVQERLVNLFGREICLPDGAVDRSRVAQKAFESSVLTEQLNQMMHPVIWEREEQWLSVQDSPYVVIEASVLIESGGSGRMDRVIVVLADKALRKERVLKRSKKVDEEHFDAIISRQCSDAIRLSHADDVIYNNEDLETLQVEVELLHSKLLRQFDS